MNTKTVIAIVLAVILSLSVASFSFAGAKEENAASKELAISNLGGSQPAAPASDSSSPVVISGDLEEDLAIFGAGAAAGAAALLLGALAFFL